MLEVGINGYGTIGKRVADAVRAQPDMEVAGVAKRRPNVGAELAIRLGYPLYVAGTSPESFEERGLDYRGTVDELIERSDVIVDATPAGVGAQNRPKYEARNTPAIFQGGEDPSVAEVSFAAGVNYDAASNERFVRVVSCNTTGLVRLVPPLSTFGIEKMRATLIRRGGDPAQSDRGPINDTVLDPVSIPSHHGPDVNEILPELDIVTVGVTVPTTLMHTHAVNVTLEESPPPEALREQLSDERRLIVLPEDTAIDGAGMLKETALDTGRPRGDYWENCVWGGSLAIRDRDCYFFQAIHQEADVIPENIDAIRAVAGLTTKKESLALTDEHLGVGLTPPTPRQPIAADR